MNKKYVYFFGNKIAEGNGSMKQILGGKGAGLAEMTRIGLPVPGGFTLTTEVCDIYYKNNKKYPEEVGEQVDRNLKNLEKIVGKTLGDPNDPLLVSVRSGASISMPGMMETILNCGLTEDTIPGLIKLTNDPRFVYDSYRRLIVMYSDMVMEKVAGIEADWDKGIRRQHERILSELKSRRGFKSDTELSAEDLKELCGLFKARVKKVFKKEFPDNPLDQLWGSINAVLASWRGKRAVSYRQIEGIPDTWGTAVNVQAMVFGNMGEDSCAGIAFTRNPGTGENAFFGEFLPSAQGEDVVAGLRPPQPINEASRNEQYRGLKSLEQLMPAAYKELVIMRARLEKHFRDMLDIEFTIEKGKLYLLACLVARRSAPAALRLAMEMYKEKLITKEEAALRVTPEQLEELSQPVFDPKAEFAAIPVSKGLPAVRRYAAGMIVFTAEDAFKWNKKGKPVILVREETNPEDMYGIRAAQGVLTARGGMTSEAALAAHSIGKCCIAGCGDMGIDIKTKTLFIGNQVLKEGDWLSLNGCRGLVYKGKLEMLDEANEEIVRFLELSNSVRKPK